MAESTDQWQDDKFNYAIDALGRSEEFAWPPAPPQHGDALLRSCREPEMLRQIVDRLGQWARTQEPPRGWQPDPLLATLPPALQGTAALKNLGGLEFSHYDGFVLQEAVWLRDLSTWARGDELDDVSRAQRLFDWTVRNIQIEDEAATLAEQPAGQPAIRLPQMPWETVLFGHGTVAERAWVFILLARQQGIDAAWLALADPADAAKPLRPWAVGVLSEGSLYLFDPSLGLPIPAPDGVKIEKGGQLTIQPATLAQAAADDAVLRRLDLDADRRYPVSAADLKHVVALVEGSPAALSKRMKLVEMQLAGPQKMVLTARPTEQAARLKATPLVAEVRLWPLPYETLQQRLAAGNEAIEARQDEYTPLLFYPATPLYKGRLLQLKGQFTGQSGATRYLQQNRRSNKYLAEMENVEKNDFIQKMYPEINRLPERDRRAAGERLKQVATARAGHYTVFMLMAKQEASLWLGLINFERANWPVAIDYLDVRTIRAVNKSPWARLASYNLGRAYEASGNIRKAVEAYQADAASPAAYGNKLRAAWLKNPPKPTGGA